MWVREAKRPLILFLLPLLLGGALGLPLFRQGGNGSLLVYAGQLAGSLCLIHRYYDWGAAGLKRPRPRTLHWPLAYGAARILIYIAIVPIIGLETDPRRLILSLLYYFGLNAAAEELHYRGLLMAGLYQQRRRLALTLIVPAALFMLPHLATSEPIWLLLFFTDGLLFGMVRIVTDSVYAPLGLHAGLNFVTAALLLPADIISPERVWLYLGVMVTTNLLFVLTLWRYRPRAFGPDRVPIIKQQPQYGG